MVHVVEFLFFNFLCSLFSAAIYQEGGKIQRLINYNTKKEKENYLHVVNYLREQIILNTKETKYYDYCVVKREERTINKRQKELIP